VEDMLTQLIENIKNDKNFKFDKELKKNLDDPSTDVLKNLNQDKKDQSEFVINMSNYIQLLWSFY
jgi:hypothetical protein